MTDMVGKGKPGPVGKLKRNETTRRFRAKGLTLDAIGRIVHGVGGAPLSKQRVWKILQDAKKKEVGK